MSGLWKLTVMEFKLFLRDTSAAVFILLFPLLMVIMMGSVYGNDPSPNFGGFGLLDVTVPALIGTIILIGGLWYLSVEIATDREKGVLRRLKATPLRPQTILTARVLRIFLIIIIGIILLILFGSAAYGLQFYGNFFSLVAAFLLSSVSLFAIGFLLAGILPNARTAQGVAMALFFVMLFFSGVVIPVTEFPENVLNFMQILPLTHVNNLLRGLWLGNGWEDYFKEVIVLASISVAGIGISLKTFRWE
jgi:ABC-2 type transport system permease protein